MEKIDYIAIKIHDTWEKFNKPITDNINEGMEIPFIKKKERKVKILKIHHINHNTVD